MQAKLLRALQERMVRPVGGDVEVAFDARIVAATHLDLEREVAEKRFREDLLFRINVVHVSVPPLRDRGRDVLSVAAFLLRKHQPGSLRVVGFTPAVIKAFLSYPWPGNVRELENVIQRAVALAQFDHVTPGDLPESMRPTQVAEGLDLEPGSRMITLRELEHRYIAHVLRATTITNPSPPAFSVWTAARCTASLMRWERAAAGQGAKSLYGPRRRSARGVLLGTGSLGCTSRRRAPARTRELVG
jgi:DNA-binding NtrC family response regulator